MFRDDVARIAFHAGQGIARMTYSLAKLIPDSNRFEIPTLRRGSSSSTLESVYGIGRAREGGDFHGSFATRDDSDQPTWCRRFARYAKDEFHDNNDGPTRFSDVMSALPRADLGGRWLNYRPALEFWVSSDKSQIEPYTTEQDYGSCVDASFSELVTMLLGFRAAHPELFPSEQPEEYLLAVAWYLYAERGYCSDGWDGFSIASKAKKFGIAFRKKYASGSTTADFYGDDSNENIVARQWCRTGIPSWMAQESQANHMFDPKAITEFDGGVAEMAQVLAAGGGLHFGGTKTSGGSRPFIVGNVGGHEQGTVGGDGSEEYRRFAQDIIGVKLADNDFAIINNQTWGAGWSGECADKYWPAFWGPKPQGAWVWKASDLLKYFEGDILAYLPFVKGFPRKAPQPSPVPTPGPSPLPIPAPNVSAITISGGFRVTATGPGTQDFIPVPRLVT